MTPAPADSNTRQRILDTALAEVERHGLTVSLEHLGLERIIKASGVSRATAYRHWPTKADFLADVDSTCLSRDCGSRRSPTSGASPRRRNGGR